MSSQATTGGSKLFKLEDWWAVWIGLFVFLLGLGPIFGSDLLGWVVKTSSYTDIGKAMAPLSKTYSNIPGYVSLILTYLFFLAVTTVGAAAMGANVKRFMLGFTIIFGLTYACIVLGESAWISVPPDPARQAKAGITWSLGLGEMGLVFAMIVGLIIGNFFTGFAKFLEEAAKPEWFIKTGIVILGAALGIKTIEAAALASTIIVRGLCAVVEAYLIYWPVVYFVSRRYFKFTPEWAAPLASGISICGVSAAIATGAAIRARPVVPVVLSAVIIVFVAVELLFLPFLAAATLSSEPMVAGAWMGLAVKSDGGAIASGTLTEALIYSKVQAASGIKYAKDWVLMVTTTTKIFIDIFIGVWAFILAIIWSMFRIDKRGGGAIAGQKISPMEIWDRFPKFIIGFAATLLFMFLLGLTNPDIVKPAKTGADQANALRSIFFALCFFSIGLVTNVRKLWAEGMGKIVVVYAVCLFGFILWVGLFISWVFYHGIMPPLA
ncbi:MAG: putative sulfate exporter family transporter [Desulfocucumaceae bacterium]